MIEPHEIICSYQPCLYLFFLVSLLIWVIIITPLVFVSLVFHQFGSLQPHPWSSIFRFPIKFCHCTHILGLSLSFSHQFLSSWSCPLFLFSFLIDFDHCNHVPSLSFWFPPLIQIITTMSFVFVFFPSIFIIITESLVYLFSFPMDLYYYGYVLSLSLVSSSISMILIASLVFLFNFLSISVIMTTSLVLYLQVFH